MIARAAADRFRTAGDGRDAVTVTGSRFVGRVAELAQLEEGLAAAAAGDPAAFAVGGEAGVGKSRLIREFVKRARASGATGLVGGCVEVADGGLPFWPFVDALRGYGDNLDGSAREELFGPGAVELARILPALSSGSELAAPSVGPSAQGRLFELFLGLLTRLAAPAPVVLVLEDLHWSDRSTRELLAFLVGNLRRERVVLLVTYRSDELYRGHPLRAFLGELHRGRVVQSVELGAFTRPELAEHMQDIAGAAVPPALVDSVFERSEGNAFFAEELQVAAGELEAGELPSTLRDILLSRIEDRSSAAQEVLRVAAVGGRAVPERLLAVVCPLLPGERIAALREVVAHQLLVPQGAETYAFRHALLREVVYQELLPGERGRFHEAYGDALIAHPELAGDETAVAAELAHHWLAAHDLPRALEASVQAGRAAEATWGFAEACVHFERALELWDIVPDAEKRAGVDRSALLRSAAEAANLAGDHGRASTLMRAAIAGAEPACAGLLWERLGRYLWAAGDSARALRAYDEALRLVPAEPASAARARVLAARGQSLMLMARYEESRGGCEQAIAVARDTGARAEEGHALNTLGADFAYLGDPVRAVEHLTEARRIAEEVGDLDDLARAYLNLSDVLGGPLNRLEEAVTVALEGSRLAHRVGLARDYGVSLEAVAAGALLGLGRWDEAGVLLCDAEDRDPVEMAAIDLHLCHARLVARRGAFERAAAHLSAARRLMTHTVDPQYQSVLHAREAELALWQGRCGDARAAVAAGLRSLEGSDDVWFVGPLLWLGARTEADGRAATAARGRDAEPASWRAAADALRARAADLLRANTACDRFVSPVTLAYALLCEAESQRLFTRVEPDAWQAAAAAWKRLGDPYHEAYARWREAEVLLTRRRKRDAIVSLRSAHTMAQQLGARPLVCELELLARRARIDLGGDDPVTANVHVSPAAQLGLTPRECQVLQLIADGQTNREIAGALFVSEKTAGAHVSNILGKLGVRGRVEAATTAHRLGLIALRV